MSPKGRPEGELAPKQSAEGSLMSAPGRPKRERAPKREARQAVQ
jgi:hypothetical protein